MRIRTSSKLFAVALTPLVGWAITAPAFAFVKKDGLESSRITARTATTKKLPRANRTVSSQVPLPAARGMEALRTARLSHAMWDAQTDVPLRVWGRGIDAPGSTADAAIAESAARNLLAQYLPTLAPGAQPSDFDLVSNVLFNDARTVAFVQRWHGMRVIGGQVSFLFKRDHMIVMGSEALPNIDATMPRQMLSVSKARTTAQSWIAQAASVTARASDVGERVVLPLVRSHGKQGPDIEYRVAHSVRVDAVGHAGTWDVFVDANDGSPIARQSRLHFDGPSTGTMLYHAPLRFPGDAEMDYPASFATQAIDGTEVNADINGVVSWLSGVTGTVVPQVAGTYVAVTNGLGAAVTTSLSIDPNGTTTWNVGSVITDIAQTSAYIHANIVKQYARTHFYPNLDYVNGVLSVTTNEQNMGTCNAYSTGDDVHFFPGDNTCQNTGTLADVVYHEFGHSLHNNAVIQGVGFFESSLSEGLADYDSANITGDPNIGPGFFTNGDPIRDIDPVGTEAKYPDDFVDVNAGGDPHTNGLIISGALWDLRKALILSMGEDAAIAATNKIFYGEMQRAADIPSTFVEALVADDDDGDLDNGTPNQCAIVAAFTPHGLTANTLGDPVLGTPTLDGLNLTLPIAAPAASNCPPPQPTSGVLTWQVRGNTATTGTVNLTTGDTNWTATLPTQPDGTVIQYQIAVTFSDGSVTTLPNNPADPFYETYVGAVTKIYCNDFEIQPTDWTHSATTGTDDWQWGTTGGATAGSPDAVVAHGGTHVFGIQLGDDGLYQPSTTESLVSPMVATTGFTNVRLQYYRWLTSEDAAFDHSTISANGTVLWTNFATPNASSDGSDEVNHVDREWRFQDVDLSAQAASGNVQVAFGLSSDEGLQLGGWTVDDLCIVGTPLIATAVCGDGIIEAGEQCDDGNTVSGDGCSSTCQLEGIDHMDPGGGCNTTSGDPAAPVVLALGALGYVLIRRRRRASV